MITVCVGRANEYERAKGILNRGRHPTFVGRDTLRRYAIQGGLLFAQVEGTDAAVAMINTRVSSLSVMNVLPQFRSQGIGAAFLSYLRPNWARVVESAVTWFQSQGYVQVGDYKVGRKLRTAIMVRTELIGLSGRVAEAYQHGCRCADDRHRHERSI